MHVPPFARVRPSSATGKQGIRLDSQRLAGLGPHFATVLTEALPELDPLAKGLSVLLTTNEHRRLTIQATTTRKFGHVFGVRGKASEDIWNAGRQSPWGMEADTNQLVKDVRRVMQKARTDLIEKWEATHGTARKRRSTSKAKETLKGLQRG